MDLDDWVLYPHFYVMCFAPYFRLSSSSKLKSIVFAARSVAETQFGSIYQHIMQKTMTILRHELLIYQHFCIKVGSGESSSSLHMFFLSNVVITKIDHLRCIYQIFFFFSPVHGLKNQ